MKRRTRCLKSVNCEGGKDLLKALIIHILAAYEAWEKYGLKVLLRKKSMGKGIRKGRKSHEEECLLTLILPYIGEYSVRNKHKNGAVQSCTTPFFLF